MRGIDWQLATILKYHWLGLAPAGMKLCPLLADLDRLLAYLDEIGLRPGHAIDACPECGEEHRWALLKMLMIEALSHRPKESSKLLQIVDTSLEPVRALYGGETGMRSMMAEAEMFFAKLNAPRVPKPPKPMLQPKPSKTLLHFLDDAE